MRGSGEWAGAFLEVCELSQARAGTGVRVPGPGQASGCLGQDHGSGCRGRDRGQSAGPGVRVPDQGSGCRGWTTGQGAGAGPGVRMPGLG